MAPGTPAPRDGQQRHQHGGSAALVQHGKGRQDNAQYHAATADSVSGCLDHADILPVPACGVKRVGICWCMERRAWRGQDSEGNSVAQQKKVAATSKHACGSPFICHILG